MLCHGYDLVDQLKANQKATCKEGLYIGYTVQKYEYGDVLVWPNGEIVDDNGKNNPFFKYSKWKINVDE